MAAIRREIKMMRSEQLPDLYRDLLQLTEEEPSAGRTLSRQIRTALQMYVKLLEQLEESSSAGVNPARLYVAQKRLEDAFEGAASGTMSRFVEASLPEYSRKRTLLRKFAILEALKEKGKEPLSGSEIAKLMISKGLATNAPTVITHLSRMRRDGFITSLASGVFQIAQPGRDELQRHRRGNGKDDPRGT